MVVEEEEEVALLVAWQLQVVAEEVAALAFQASLAEEAKQSPVVESTLLLWKAAELDCLKRLSSFPRLRVEVSVFLIQL